VRAGVVAAAIARRGRSGETGVASDFAELLSIDVTHITGEQRSRLFKQLGDGTFGVVIAIIAIASAIQHFSR
jgi:hypothetical protein